MRRGKTGRRTGSSVRGHCRKGRGKELASIHPQPSLQNPGADIRHGLRAWRVWLGQPGLDDASAAGHGEGLHVTAVAVGLPGGEDAVQPLASGFFLQRSGTIAEDQLAQNFLLILLFLGLSLLPLLDVLIAFLSKTRKLWYERVSDTQIVAKLKTGKE